MSLLDVSSDTRVLNVELEERGSVAVALEDKLYCDAVYVPGRCCALPHLVDLRFPFPKNMKGSYFNTHPIIAGSYGVALFVFLDVSCMCLPLTVLCSVVRADEGPPLLHPVLSIPGGALASLLFCQPVSLRWCLFMPRLSSARPMKAQCWDPFIGAPFCS